MSTNLSRRQFTVLAAAGFAGALFPAAAGESLNRKGKARLHLSLAAYGFRDFFKDASHPRPDAAPAGQPMDMFSFIDYCADHNCAAEVTSYYFPADAGPDFLLKVKRHAFLRGVELSGTSVGNTFTHPAGAKRDREIKVVQKWIDHAAIMGAPHVRVFAGNREGQSLEQAKKNCIESLEECCAYASRKGVFLGIENHGGIVAEPDVLIDIVKAVDSPWLGINLDTGNFHTDDPYADLERCAPYAVNVQVKTEIRAREKQKTNADLARLIKILREANYQGYVVLEYEAQENPYQAIPRVLSELRALL